MPGSPPRFNETQLRQAIASSYNWAQTLRRLGYCPTGGNPMTIKKYVKRWSIDVSHFDPERGRYRGARARRIPLDEVLVEHSNYNRGNLKKRLYTEGLKDRRCEGCGQGELWNGSQMSLILDHINGVRDDNRLENLRVVCPNCAATLPTHCGKGLRKPRVEMLCELCGIKFNRRFRAQRFCSRDCGQRAGACRNRRVERPPYDQLMREIAASSYLAVGRRYGVSDNAIRKWVRAYEREAAEGPPADA